MNQELPLPAPAHFIMFTGEPRRTHAIDWISPRAFLHCFTFHYDSTAERWVLYEVNRNGTGIAVLTSDEFDRWLMFMRTAKAARVLRFERPEHSPIRAPVQFGMWCVVAVRYMIGLRSRALRPIGLWRDLLKAGAQEVFVA